MISVPGAGTPYGVFPSQAQLYAAAAAAQGPPPTYDQSLAHPAAATAAAVNQQVTSYLVKHSTPYPRILVQSVSFQILAT